MTQNNIPHTPEAEHPQGIDRSLLEFLKPKSEERYSKLEAYCDLLSRASSGAYSAPGSDGTLQLLPGQFVATISELARFWQWQRATVRQFLSGLTNLGQLSVQPYSKSFIFSVNLEQRLSLFVESPDDILDFCAMQFGRFVKGRLRAKEVADAYTRYYDLKMRMAAQEGNGGIPARHVLKEQAVVFDGLAVTTLRILGSAKEMPETLSDSVNLLFGKDHLWDWHKVIDILGILAVAIRGNTKPSYMDSVNSRYTKGEVVLMDCIYEHYVSDVGSTYFDNPPRPSVKAQESDRGTSPMPSPSIED
jgi:hypothetical protein